MSDEMTLSEAIGRLSSIESYERRLRDVTIDRDDMVTRLAEEMQRSKAAVASKVRHTKVIRTFLPEAHQHGAGYDGMATSLMAYATFLRNKLEAIEKIVSTSGMVPALEIREIIHARPQEESGEEEDSA